MFGKAKRKYFAPLRLWHNNLRSEQYYRVSRRSVCGPLIPLSSYSQALGRPFKFIVNCVIVQNSNAGLNIATSVFWDSDRDGECEFYCSICHLYYLVPPLLPSFNVRYCFLREYNLQIRWKDDERDRNMLRPGCLTSTFSDKKSRLRTSH